MTRKTPIVLASFVLVVIPSVVQASVDAEWNTISTSRLVVSRLFSETTKTHGNLKLNDDGMFVLQEGVGEVSIGYTGTYTHSAAQTNDRIQLFFDASGLHEMREMLTNSIKRHAEKQGASMTDIGLQFEPPRNMRITIGKKISMPKSLTVTFRGKVHATLNGVPVTHRFCYTNRIAFGFAGGSSTTTVGGNISEDTTWSGEVLVESTVEVDPGVTLSIQPGTQVKFRHYRGYREPEKRLFLFIRGILNAEGTALQPIYFTSDATDPQNGDWSMVRLLDPTGQCSIRYAVFQFAQQGLNIWQADVFISHSVFRWNNWEGAYLESGSSAVIESCQIVENGYNGLAAEQFCTVAMDTCEVWRNGTNGVHVDATDLEIVRSRIHDNRANGLSVDDNGAIRTLGDAIYDNTGYGIGFGQGNNVVQVGNVLFFGNGAGTIGGPYTAVPSSFQVPDQVDIGFVADQTHALAYIPGDPLLDTYLYVYPDDETRRVARKIGQGLGLTWSVAFDGQHIWTATVQGDVYRLDPVTGQVLQQFASPGPQPWGMTFDGEHLWIVDFAEKRISEVDPANGQELRSFPTPDPVGGCKGVAWDGTYLNVMGWTSATIYRMDRLGNPIGTIQLDTFATGGIAWDGSHFWVPAGRILRFDTQGHAVGWIYPASEGTWDMAWDGHHLWATQRTNENWSDAKLFALEILQVNDP